MWSRQQYEDAIRAHLGDLGIIQHTDDTRIPLALRAALADLTKDRPGQTTDTLSGDGTTKTFDLTTLAGWEPAWSDVETIEHPTGDIPRTFLDPHDWTTYDDTLELEEAPEAGADNIRVRYTYPWPFPTDDPADDPTPSILAEAVAARAAAKIIRGKAIEYARQQSTSVAGDLFPRDPGPLFEAARELDSIYKDTAIGASGPDEPKATNLATIDIDTFPASLFHRRAEYVSEEALGD